MQYELYELKIINNKRIDFKIPAIVSRSSSILPKRTLFSKLTYRSRIFIFDAKLYNI